FFWCASSEQETPSAQALTNWVSPYPRPVILEGETPCFTNQAMVDLALLSDNHSLYLWVCRLSVCERMSKVMPGCCSRTSKILRRSPSASLRMLEWFRSK